jgi:ribosomal protein L25 (general stress protein Ctc)
MEKVLKISLLLLWENEVRKIWRDVRGTEIFTLDVEGQSFPVIMKDIQAHVVSGELLNIDFLIQK